MKGVAYIECWLIRCLLSRGFERTRLWALVLYWMCPYPYFSASGEAGLHWIKRRDPGWHNQRSPRNKEQTECPNVLIGVAFRSSALQSGRVFTVYRADRPESDYFMRFMKFAERRIGPSLISMTPPGGHALRLMSGRICRSTGTIFGSGTRPATPFAPWLSLSDCTKSKRKASRLGWILRLTRV